MVLDVDEQKRRISLDLKQCLSNPWDDFVANHPADAELEGEIKNITEFGLFVGLPGDIDGMVHLSDLDWSRSGEDAVRDYSKGDVVKVKVLDVDVEKERISLGIKQLTEDPFGQAAETLRKGAIVTGTVHQVVDGGIEVRVGDGVLGFIRKAELSRDRSEQRPDRFAVGEKLDAKVVSIDKKTRKGTLSIKQREIQEEKQAMAEYGSSDSGASLGDILGAAFSRAAKEKETQEDASETGTEKKAKKKAEKKVDESADKTAEKEEKKAKKKAEKKADESADETAEKEEKKAKTAKKKPAKAAKKSPKEPEKSDAGDTPEAGDDTAE